MALGSRYEAERASRVKGIIRLVLTWWVMTCQCCDNLALMTWHSGSRYEAERAPRVKEIIRLVLTWWVMTWQCCDNLALMTWHWGSRYEAERAPRVKEIIRDITDFKTDEQKERLLWRTKFAPLHVGPCYCMLFQLRH